MNIPVTLPSLSQPANPDQPFAQTAAAFRPPKAVRRVAATEVVEPLHGATRPLLMRADDGHLYVVKLATNPHGPRILVNEFVAWHLAAELGLPTPRIAIILVPSAVGGVAEGVHFGSRLCRNRRNSVVHDWLPLAAWKYIQNPADLVGAFLLDLWLGNADRRQVVFARGAGPQPFKLSLIDHSHCFGGPSWRPCNGYADCAYPARHAYDGVTGWADLEPWLSRLKQMHPQRIRMAAHGLPTEWLGDGDRFALQRLLLELVARRTGLRATISAMIAAGNHPFKKWKGTPRPFLLPPPNFAFMTAEG